MRSTRLFALAATALLTGCNAPSQTGPVIDPMGPPRQTVTPSTFQMPEGAGCSGAIARYRAVMENDLSMGHVNQSVYGQIQGEISEASSACAAGQDARALSLVRASKARHGYPGG